LTSSPARQLGRFSELKAEDSERSTVPEPPGLSVHLLLGGTAARRQYIPLPAGRDAHPGSVWVGRWNG